MKHQVSEALKSPDDYRRHSALCDVCNKLQVKKREVEEAGIATSWSDFGVFPSTRIPTREDSHCGGRGGGRIRESAEEGEFFKVKLKSLNYLTIFLSCSNSNSQNPTEMN